MSETTTSGGYLRLPKEAEVPVEPEPYLVTLPGAQTVVRLIGPPGQAGDLLPSWAATTSLGRDEAAFGKA